MKKTIRMKQLKPLLVILFFTKVIFAQEAEECRKIVNYTIESINSGSSQSLDNYLSDDFTIAGQKGEMARLILSKLFSQLGDSVKSFNEIKQNKIENELELVYDIDYKKMGLKESTFIFDENNMLKDLKLFKIEVKKMNKQLELGKSKNDIIEIPFTMAGNLIAVEVLLNGEKRKFLLDSGSPKVILNSKYITKKDTTSRKTITSSKGVNGNISGMDIIQVNELDFNGIKFDNQEVITLDLSHLEESLETDFYGLIGYELIKDYDIIFDYEKHVLTLINPAIFEKYKNENLSAASLEHIPFDLEGHIPVVKSKVGSSTLSFGIDCGAESNLISDKLFEQLKEHTKHIEVDELIGAENKPKEANKGEILETHIGNKTFKNLPTIFSDIDHLNEGYKMDIDGLFGYEVLNKQKTLISYERKEMIFIE